MIVMKTGADAYRGEFRYFRGRARYTRERVDGAPPGDAKRIVHAFSADRHESLIETAELNGTIERNRKLPQLEYIDIALGLREYDADEWLSDATLRGAGFAAQKDGLIRLTWRGRATGRVEHVMLFDPQVGYAMVQYKRTVDGNVATAIENSKFSQVSNVLMPFKIVHTRYLRDNREARPSEVVSFDVAEYKIGDARNADDDFRIEWPLGSLVADVETGAHMHVKSRAQKLEDDTIVKAAAAMRPDAPSSQSRTYIMIVLAAITLVTLFCLTLLRLRRTRRI
jgi:hypothetical protein